MVAGTEIVWLVLLAVAKDPAATAGEPIPIRVEFEAPAGCSDVDAFYAGVLSRSDRARRAGSGEHGLRLGVRLTRVGGKVIGELRVLDGRGETDTRKMEGVRCDEVVEVLSLTAALAIDPAARLAPTHATGKPPAPPPATPPEPPPPLPPPPPPEPPPTPPIAPPSADTGDGAPRAFALGLGVSTVAGQVIAPTIDLGGAISLRLTRFHGDRAGPSLTVAALYLSNDLVQSAADVAITLVGAYVVACPGLSAGSAIVIEACAYTIGGRLTADARGLTNPGSASRSWVSVGALMRASVSFGGGFSLELEAGLGLPLTRRQFSTSTPERVVGETPVVSGLVGLGLARRL